MWYNELWVEDAIKGGYIRNKRSIEYMLLDIRAWEAVGRTRNWVHVMNNGTTQPAWRTKMTTFFFRLQRKHTIEEALGAITDVV